MDPFVAMGVHPDLTDVLHQPRELGVYGCSVLAKGGHRTTAIRHFAGINSSTLEFYDMSFSDDLIESEAMSTEIEVQARQTILNYGVALQAADLGAVLSLYTDESEIVPDGVPSLRGLEGIEQFYRGTFESIKIKGDLQIVDIRAWDEVAVVRCEEPATVTALADGSQESSYFREIFVLENRDGSWKILKYMFSQNPGQAKI